MNRFSSDFRFRLSLGVFILSCILLTTSYRTTFVFDHPINSAVLACILAASVLLFLGIPGAHNSHSFKLSHAFVAEYLETLDVRLPAIGCARGIRIVKIQEWIKVALVACIVLCVRIELYRQITVYNECAPTGYAYAIPFLISLYDYFRDQRSRQVEDYTLPSEQLASVHLRILATSYRRFRHYVLGSRQRYLISASLISLGGLLASAFHKGQSSTYICPLVSGEMLRIWLFRNTSALLDAILLIGVAEISREWANSPEEKRRPLIRLCGYLLLGVAAFWTVVGVIITLRHGRGGITLSVDDRYVQSAIGQGLLVTSLLAASLQLIPHFGILGICMLAGFITIYTSSTAALIDVQHPFPLIYSSNAITAYFAVCAGMVTFLYVRAATEEDVKSLPKMNIMIRLSFVLLLGFGLIFAGLQPEVANVHPIDLLIFKSRIRHNDFISQARVSNGLKEAVEEYRRRYNQHPPPKFDQWYYYAISRGSMVVDDFDQIYTDLLPFRALPPQRLRELTHLLATNPVNDIGAISIRGGKPRVQDGIKPTHAWMVLAAAEMIEKFSEHLPDMDIAFNLDDQPRVAVPWGDISAMRDMASFQVPPEHALNGWSLDRGLGWAPIEPAYQTNETVFTDASWQGIFDEYVSRLCPPSSEARSRRVWDRREVCLSCIRPHSLGQFPTDWNLVTDICHQPDLGALHGFLIAPTAFGVSRELVPVFSQSSVSGFNDILYPSPWNYIDKAKYEPSEKFPDLEYEQKHSSMFWIGSTSEGMSNNGGWRGMGRQRFVHLVNNNTRSKVSVLLPTRQSRAYSYQILDGSAPSKDLGLQTEVSLAGPISHCGDCDDQERELGAAPTVDFQSNWAYRYLFDLDGAGFSGRFLPFLQSRSLPFKTGLFRQWFDSRITPWLHYVPVDLRLHGMWSTLAYFTGVEGELPEEGLLGWRRTRRKVRMEPHDKQGKLIAEEGRNWAAAALRKEDMEIYFFRLLLEWGRLTDDHRDILGFEMEGED